MFFHVLFDPPSASRSALPLPALNEASARRSLSPSPALLALCPRWKTTPRLNQRPEASRKARTENAHEFLHRAIVYSCWCGLGKNHRVHRVRRVHRVPGSKSLNLRFRFLAPRGSYFRNLGFKLSELGFFEQLSLKKWVD